MNLSKLRETVKDSKAWHAAVHEVTKSQTQLSDWTTTATLENSLALEDLNIYLSYDLAIPLLGINENTFPTKIWMQVFITAL